MSIKSVAKKIIRRMVLPAIREDIELANHNLESIISNSENRINGFVETRVNYVDEKTNRLEGTVKYCTDTLAEKSYLIDVALSELKRIGYENDRLKIQNEFLLAGAPKGTGRIIQIVPVLKYGDAVGNCAVTIHNALQKNGFDSSIYAEVIDDRMQEDYVHMLEELPIVGKSDILLLHIAAETKVAHTFGAYAGKKVLLYHNITPSHFFHGYDDFAERSTADGRISVKELSKDIDYAVADSEYSAGELREMGYECPIEVMDLPIALHDFDKSYDEALYNSIKEKSGANIIFVGRIAPNKKIEDVMNIFSEYRKKYDKDANLYLVGNFNEEDLYYKELLNYKDSNIHFSGHIRFEQIIAYYKAADLFLCMSEHEGFCAPLMEAMYMNVPIVAYRSSAVPETLKDGGVLVDTKEPGEVAEIIYKVLTDQTKLEEMQQSQKRIIRDYFEKQKCDGYVSLVNNIGELV